MLLSCGLDDRPHPSVWREPFEALRSPRVCGWAWCATSEEPLMTRQRLPKGTSNRCPRCRRFFRCKRPASVGSLNCPQCGARLWYRPNSGRLLGIETIRPGALFFDAQDMERERERIIEAIAKHSNLSPEYVRSKIALEDLLGTDSVDIVELVMELEDEFKNQGSCGHPA